MMMMVSSTTMSLAVLLLLASTLHAFVPSIIPATTTTSTSRLYLDKSIADMIDHEVYRQGHQEQYRKEWMEKNRPAILRSMQTEDAGPTTATLTDDSDFRQHRKDQLMAEKNPQQYCADRCIATGNCDVFEDFFQLSPEDVIGFCNDCVLAEDEEPCDIPDAFFDSGKLTP